MTVQGPLAALLRHLEQAPGCPLPEDLQGPLLAWLRRSRAHRDRILRDLAAHIDPLNELGRWPRAQRVAAAVQRFQRPENGARAGRRPPANRTEELLVEAQRCGCGLPASPRRVWDALDEGVSKNTG